MAEEIILIRSECIWEGNMQLYGLCNYAST